MGTTKAPPVARTEKGGTKGGKGKGQGKAAKGGHASVPSAVAAPEDSQLTKGTGKTKQGEPGTPVLNSDGNTEKKGSTGDSGKGGGKKGSKGDRGKGNGQKGPTGDSGNGGGKKGSKGDNGHGDGQKGSKGDSGKGSGKKGSKADSGKGGGKKGSNEDSGKGGGKKGSTGDSGKGGGKKGSKDPNGHGDGQKKSKGNSGQGGQKKGSNEDSGKGGGKKGSNEDSGKGGGKKGSKGGGKKGPKEDSGKGGGKKGSNEDSGKGGGKKGSKEDSGKGGGKKGPNKDSGKGGGKKGTIGEAGMNGAETISSENKDTSEEVRMQLEKLDELEYQRRFEAACKHPWLNDFIKDELELDPNDQTFEFGAHDDIEELVAFETYCLERRRKRGGREGKGEGGKTKTNGNDVATTEAPKVGKRKLTAVEIAWGRQRGYDWTQSEVQEYQPPKTEKSPVCRMDSKDSVATPVKSTTASSPGQGHSSSTLWF